MQLIITKDDEYLELEDIEYIKQSSKSAYGLSKELPYSKASILKVRRGVY